MDLVVHIDSTLCNGCEKCVDVCKQNILYINDFTGLCDVSEHNKCDRDKACVKACPNGAIKID